MRINPRTAAAITLPVILLTAGCVHRGHVIRERFLLEAQRDSTPSPKAAGRILAVQPFSIASAYEGKGVVSCVSENQYKSDFYGEYFVGPAQMITEQTRNWLSGSGLFDRVLSPVSLAEPTDVLEGYVRKMFLDLRDLEKPQAVLEITFVLLEHQKRDEIIRFQETYSMSHPMESRSIRDYVTAQSQCLHDILTKLESDLAARL
jgi:ABC-type uncharacterized transport system auxiliary subunit